MTFKDGISVVICCYNSQHRISQTLKHLAHQKHNNGISWEVILINNNSTDNTKEIAIKEWAEYSIDIPLKVIDELMPGLSYARSKGFESANFENVLFCDDDNWLSENYIQIAYEVLKGNPEIGVLGGKIEASFEVNPPQWFNNYKYAYAVGEQGGISGDISDRGFVWGAGMVIRKRIWKQIVNTNIESFLTDRKGSSLSSGGDSELCLFALLLGYKLWYHSELFLIHFIPVSRLNWSYVIALTKGFGVAEVSLVGLKKILSKKRMELPLDYKLSWKSEIYRISSLLLKHPKRTILGFIGGEGSGTVIWLTYFIAYLKQLGISNNMVDRAFLHNEKNLLNITKENLL